mmetsp:Transcript_121885/g.344749  ORF Transcript_121885/g.344749 Transcript_121885/m.344749 type:complete len:225 (+) Transcript_121885:3490-4164(+)
MRGQSRNRGRSPQSREKATGQGDAAVRAEATGGAGAAAAGAPIAGIPRRGRGPQTAGTGAGRIACPRRSDAPRGTLLIGGQLRHRGAFPARSGAQIHAVVALDRAHTTRRTISRTCSRADQERPDFRRRCQLDRAMLVVCGAKATVFRPRRRPWHRPRPGRQVATLPRPPRVEGRRELRTPRRRTRARPAQIENSKNGCIAWMAGKARCFGTSIPSAGSSAAWP